MSDKIIIRFGLYLNSMITNNNNNPLNYKIFLMNITFLVIFLLSALLLFSFFLSPQIQDHTEEPLTSEERALFDEWARKYGKTYTTEEDYLHRFKIFIDRFYHLSNITMNITHEVALNKFSDLTHDELKEMYHKGHIHLREPKKSLTKKANAELEITGIIIQQ